MCSCCAAAAAAAAAAVEFYFSDDNIVTDEFMLRQVRSNPDGWGELGLGWGWSVGRWGGEVVLGSCCEPRCLLIARRGQGSPLYSRGWCVDMVGARVAVVARSAASSHLARRALALSLSPLPAAVPIKVIASFNKMKKLTRKQKVLLDALRSGSAALEVSPEGQRVR